MTHGEVDEVPFLETQESHVILNLNSKLLSKAGYRLEFYDGVAHYEVRPDVTHVLTLIRYGNYPFRLV